MQAVTSVFPFLMQSVQSPDLHHTWILLIPFIGEETEVQEKLKSSGRKEGGGSSPASFHDPAKAAALWSLQWT